MNDTPPNGEPGQGPGSQPAKAPAGSPLKNIAYFVGSMAAAYLIIQGVKLFVHPWLVSIGLWPLSGG